MASQQKLSIVSPQETRIERVPSPTSDLYRSPTTAVGSTHYRSTSPTTPSYATYSPTRISRPRAMLHEYAAEFFGVMILVIFGCGVNCQAVLSSNTNASSAPKGDFGSITIAWGVGLAFGGWISGCGHINPAVTIALATWRRFPWYKVPGFIICQLFGGLIGAAIVYANYFHAIDIYEGGRGVRTLATAGLFGTYGTDYMTNVSCFFSEFIGTAMLMLGILSVLDPRNRVPKCLIPIALFFFLAGITAALGWETSFAVNPARDLGPRLLTSMVGYGGQVYSYRNQYWIWCPIIATVLGAQVATILYDTFLYKDGGDSVICRRLYGNNFYEVEPPAPELMDSRRTGGVGETKNPV
ncbi:aquaporin-like protein [Schizophyllum fasciatum]